MIQPGTTVIACTQSAMFDEGAYADPATFDPRRTMYQTFTLGYGHHECLGRAIATVMIPEIVRQVLLLPGSGRTARSSTKMACPSISR
jgi:cytochrome P450